MVLVIIDWIELWGSSIPLCRYKDPKIRFDTKNIWLFKIGVVKLSQMMIVGWSPTLSVGGNVDRGFQLPTLSIAYATWSVVMADQKPKSRDVNPIERL